MDVWKLLHKREFLNTATCDKQGRPSATPKFILKVDKPYIYLVDYSYGRTIANLRANPQISLTFMDLDKLDGYRMDGSVELIEAGEEHARLAKELERRALKLSADRVIEGTRTGKRYEHFELEIPDKFVIFKIKIAEIVKIGARGDFYSESVDGPVL